MPDARSYNHYDVTSFRPMTAPVKVSLFEEAHYYNPDRPMELWVRERNYTEGDETEWCTVQASDVGGPEITSVIERIVAPGITLLPWVEALRCMVLRIDWVSGLSIDIVKYGPNQYYTVGTQRTSPCRTLGLKTLDSKLKVGVGLYKDRPFYKHMAAEEKFRNIPAFVIRPRFPEILSRTPGIAEAMPSLLGQRGAWMAWRLPEFVDDCDVCMDLFGLRTASDVEMDELFSAFF